ncbi:GNAT family N-acetyltransferase [Paracoccaceae bacterium Fryx2]|nr:GNAT family N-acetyltransferase [Paracoccaceae bacterium Fryx2]
MTLLRDLAGMDEFRAAEALQCTVWGAGDKEDPADLMMVVQAEGGIAAGAFEGGQLLGYVFGFPTATPGMQHSHRLAVLPQARGQGLGAALKWYQRDWCLARGITCVRWTYDPLRHANAALNIARLGARVSVYCQDYYGVMAGINSGSPSDRLLADWALDAPHVAALAAGGVADAPADALRIAIPADFGALLTADPAAALAARLEVRAAMQAAFADGLAVQGYDVVRREYLLAR